MFYLLLNYYDDLQLYYYRYIGEKLVVTSYQCRGNVASTVDRYSRLVGA